MLPLVSINTLMDKLVENDNYNVLTLGELVTGEGTGLTRTIDSLIKAREVCDLKHRTQ